MVGNGAKVIEKHQGILIVYSLNKGAMLDIYHEFLL